MKKSILALLLVTLTLNTYAKELENNNQEINIDFGCLDCNKPKNDKKKEELLKETKKYKKKSNLKENIEVSGTITYRYDKKN